MTDLNLIKCNPGLSEAAAATTSEFATRGGAAAPLVGARRNDGIVTLTCLSSRQGELPHILC
jgi:hypothetical protein